MPLQSRLIKALRHGMAAIPKKSGQPFWAGWRRVNLMTWILWIWLTLVNKILLWIFLNVFTTVKSRMKGQNQNEILHVKIHNLKILMRKHLQCKILFIPVSLNFLWKVWEKGKWAIDYLKIQMCFPQSIIMRDQIKN